MNNGEHWLPGEKCHCAMSRMGDVLKARSRDDSGILHLENIIQPNTVKAGHEFSYSHLGSNYMGLFFSRVQNILTHHIQLSWDYKNCDLLSVVIMLFTSRHDSVCCTEALKKTVFFAHFLCKRKWHGTLLPYVNMRWGRNKGKSVKEKMSHCQSVVNIK